MQKRSLADRFKCKNDYSIFAIEKPPFRKYPLSQVTDPSFRSDFHKAKIKEATQSFQALNKLTVAEYFKYLPECIDKLRRSPFIDVDQEQNVADMTIGEVFDCLGSKKDDFEPDYAIILGKILMEPIKDSSYTHPLFKTLLIHNREMVKKLTHGRRGFYEPFSEKGLYVSMNDSLKELIQQSNLKNKRLRLYDDSEHIFNVFFNNVVIPSITVTRHF